MLPSVAIIIVTHNGSEFIGDCLSSLEKIDYPKEKCEIVIVDNASEDDTRNKISNSQFLISNLGISVKKIYNEKNLGFAGGNNQGIRYAIERGFEYAYLLNQDTEIEPDFLKKAVRVAASDQKIAAVQSRLMYADRRDMINSVGGVIHFLGYGYAKGNTESISNSQFLISNIEIAYPSGAGVLISSNVLKNIGMFCEEFFSYYEDADLGWRMWLSGYRVVLASESVVYHKYDFSRSIKSYYPMERNRYLMIFQNYKVATLILLMPALFFSEVFILATSFLTSRWMQRIKIYNYLIDLENWKKIMYHRRHIFRLRKKKDKEILKMFSGKILYQEQGGSVIKWVVNPLLELFFRLVKIAVFW